MIGIHPSGGALGADVGGVDLSQPLSSADFGAICGAWMRRHGVVGLSLRAASP
jgi:alpha-ketoglutarate-dependent taurine dioxygenase